MGVQLVTITNFQPLAGSTGSYRFTLELNTSLGILYVDGFRYDRFGRIKSPSYPAGSTWVPIVTLPRNLRAAIRNKIRNQLLKGDVHDTAGRHDRVSDDRVVPVVVCDAVG